MKRLKKSKLHIKRGLRRIKRKPEEPQSALAPRITTDTLAAHREEVIGSARKYIYPLQHAKHKIITITASLLVLGIAAFFVYCTLALYRFQSTSTFMYRVTQVIPFPVARTGGTFISYESYLFEIRHYTHYYETQLKTDFNDPQNKPQLTAFKKQALDKVVNDAYVKKMANKYNVSVSEQEIDDQIAILRKQNRLGSNDKVFEDVLQDYWGWSVEDFRRSLRDQLLSQKVVFALDTDTQDRAKAALAELDAGADFAAIAQKYSDDVDTKDTGGEIGVVERTKRDIAAQTVDALYRLEPGKHSQVITIGYSLQIVKNLEVTADDKIRAAHILFNFKDIADYLNDLKEQEKASTYIKP